MTDASAERAREQRQAPGDPTVDVIIVGAGAVGLLLACLLGSRGIEVVVLDRRAERSRRTRAIGIHPPGLAALDAAGVGRQVRQDAAQIRRGVALCRGRRLGTLDFGEDDAVLSLPQHRTESILESRLADLAPHALRRGVEVSALRGLPSRVAVYATGDERPWVARYVVGADGVRSAVRDALGVQWLRRPGAARYAMADAPDETGEPATALLHLEPDGVVESFPLPGGARRWVARLDRGLSPDAQSFAGLVAARVGAVIEGLSGPSEFVAQQRVAASFARGRVALVGDAAHEVSPIGGQGMNLGWLDAVHLDRVIAESLAIGAPGAPFDGYDRARQREARLAMRRAAFNMAMGAPTGGVRLTARNAVVRLLARPPIGDVMARAFTMRLGRR